MILNNMAVNEEYLGNISRMTECHKLQTWIAHNFFEGANEPLVKFVTTSAKMLQKKVN